MKKVTKVLQILPSLNQGGVERATVDMANAMAKMGMDAYVASNGGTLLEELSPDVTHITLPLHTKNPVKIFKNAWCLFQMIQKYGIGIVHARSRAPGWSGWLASHIARVSFITTYHAAYNATNIFKKLYNSVMARGEIVITISKFIESHVKKNYPRAKTYMIYEGIDVEYFSKTSPFNKIKPSDFFKNNLPILLVPSRQSPIKGIETMLDAMIKLRDKANLILIETGKPTYIHHIKKRILQLGLEGCVTWIPPQHDLRPFYDISTIVIVPSTQAEALGRVNIEALAMEVLLISSNLGANVESCIHNETGFLFEAGVADDLTQKITHVLSLDPSEKKRLHQNGRALVEKQFNGALMLKDTVEIYQSLSP